MKLEEKNAVMASVCRRVEGRLLHVSELQNLSIGVDLLADFSHDARMAAGGCMENNPAYHDRVRDCIFVHETKFLAKSPGVQEAILAHEIAHVLRYRTKAPPVMAQLVDDLSLPLDEEIVVDGLASRWGYTSELSEDRLVQFGEQFGDEYAEILRSAAAPDFETRALSWQQRYVLDRISRRRS